MIHEMPPRRYRLPRCCSCCRHSSIYVAFSVYPLVSSVVLQLLRLERRRGERFVGFDNYVYLFTNPTTSERFWNALVNNVEFFLDPPARRAAGRAAAGGAADLGPAAPIGRPVPHAAVHPGDAVGRDRRLHLAADHQPALGSRRLPAARQRGHGAADDLADVGVAVRRHPDGVPLRGAARDPR